VSSEFDDLLTDKSTGNIRTVKRPLQRYQAYVMSLRKFVGRYSKNVDELNNVLKTITAPPAKVEMRYRATRLQAFYSKLEAFSRIKSNLHDADDCLIGCLGYCDCENESDDEVQDEDLMDEGLEELMTQQF